MLLVNTGSDSLGLKQIGGWKIIFTNIAEGYVEPSHAKNEHFWLWEIMLNQNFIIKHFKHYLLPIAFITAHSILI